MEGGAGHILPSISQCNIHWVGRMEKNYNCCKYYRTATSSIIGSAGFETKSLYCKNANIMKKIIRGFDQLEKLLPNKPSTQPGRLWQ